ncbi:hypothetical protein HanIR_Chr01g0003361 [Helianthus annuus]|nr:hypothetical protein HanIR_Chr13g0652581 [Helianthus annuus]KAJ0620970.1 hypothetical protein HanIR_Chr01g0003361 [Helianthus annuus]
MNPLPNKASSQFVGSQTISNLKPGNNRTLLCNPDPNRTRLVPLSDCRRTNYLLVVDFVTSYLPLPLYKFRRR